MTPSASSSTTRNTSNSSTSESNYSFASPVGLDSASKSAQNENWILAECCGFNNQGNNKYEVIDIDDENDWNDDGPDETGKGRHCLGKRRVVPLPLMKADPLLYPKSVYQKGEASNSCDST